MPTENGTAGRPGSVVRVVSVPRNRPLAVLFCGPVRGMLTHWHQARSWCCPGEQLCPPSLHRARTVWKGYAPVRVWDAAAKRWAAHVLEVTEALDELLRPHVLPGQVWLLAREESHKKSGPVTGSYVERRTEAELTMPFDILPPLGRMYASAHVLLDVPNPVPPKLVLPEVDGQGPALPGAQQLAPEAEPTAADRAKTKKILTEAMRGFKPGQNGSHNGNGGR